MHWYPMARRMLLIAVIKSNPVVQNKILNSPAVNVVTGKKLFQMWNWPMSWQFVS